MSVRHVELVRGELGEGGQDSLAELDLADPNLDVPSDHRDPARQHGVVARSAGSVMPTPAAARGRP